jgi:hypothetical protein
MGHYFGLISVATIKFMFAPFYGLAFHLSFLETFICTFIGGLISAVIFYWSAEFFMKRTARKRMEKINKAIENGQVVVPKRKMTRVNKSIVKVKRSIGIWGIALFAPLFLSVPLGSIISAKFYGKNKRTFPIILIGLAMNGFAITSLAYAF